MAIPSTKIPNLHGYDNEYLSYGQIRKKYVELAFFPMSKRDILITFHPDKLPSELKKASELRKCVSLFSTRTFNDLLNLRYIDDKKIFLQVLQKNKVVIDDVVVTPLPPPPKAEPPQKPKPQPPPPPEEDDDDKNLLHLKKYRNRPSPPYRSSDFRGEFKSGNDGKTWFSKSNKNGVYRWVLHRAY